MRQICTLSLLCPLNSLGHGLDDFSVTHSVTTHIHRCEFCMRISGINLHQLSVSWIYLRSICGFCLSSIDTKELQRRNEYFSLKHLRETRESFSFVSFSNNINLGQLIGSIQSINLLRSGRHRCKSVECFVVAAQICPNVFIRSHFICLNSR